MVYKYEMDPASIVEDTEWTQFCPQMNIYAKFYPVSDGHGETSIPPSTLLSGGYNYARITVKSLI